MEKLIRAQCLPMQALQQLTLEQNPAGSTANLGGLTSSASHPDMAAAFLQSDSPERSASQQTFNQLAGAAGSLPGQA